MKTDLKYLQDIARGNKDIINEMIDIFVEQVAEVSEAMDAALGNKDYNSLGALAHKAKVSISIVGLKDLADELKSLELNTRALSQIESYPVTVEKFKLETKEAIEELLRIRNE